MPKKDQLQDVKKENPPRLWGVIWDAKIDQNRSQNESKFKTIFKSEKIALQEALGALLGRSWAHLKVDFSHFLLEIVEPVKN